MLFSLFTFRKENLAALLWTGHGAGQCHQLHLSVVLAGLPTLGVCVCVTVCWPTVTHFDPVPSHPTASVSPRRGLPEHQGRRVGTPTAPSWTCQALAPSKVV